MQTSATAREGRLAPHEVGRLRAAAVHATRTHPGPVGELLARELRACADFGYRFDGPPGTGRGLMDGLATEVLRGTQPARARPATSTAASASAAATAVPAA